MFAILILLSMPSLSPNFATAINSRNIRVVSTINVVPCGDYERVIGIQCNEPTNIIFANNYVYVVGYTDRNFPPINIYAVDAKTNAIVKKFLITPSCGGTVSAPTCGLLYDNSDGKLYVSSSCNSPCDFYKIYVIKGTQVVANLTEKGRAAPYIMTYDSANKDIYFGGGTSCSGCEGNQLLYLGALSTSSDKIVGKFSLGEFQTDCRGQLNCGQYVSGLSYDPSNQNVYVSDCKFDNVKAKFWGNTSVFNSANKMVGKIGFGCNLLQYDQANDNMYADSPCRASRPTFCLAAVIIDGTKVVAHFPGKAVNYYFEPPAYTSSMFDPSNKQMYLSCFIPCFGNTGFGAPEDTAAVSSANKIDFKSSDYSIASLYDSANHDMYLGYANSTFGYGTNVTILNPENKIVATLPLSAYQTTCCGPTFAFLYDPANKDVYIGNGTMVFAVNSASHITATLKNIGCSPAMYDQANNDVYCIQGNSEVPGVIYVISSNA